MHGQERLVWMQQLWLLYFLLGFPVGDAQEIIFMLAPRPKNQGLIENVTAAIIKELNASAVNTYYGDRLCQSGNVQNQTDVWDVANCIKTVHEKLGPNDQRVAFVISRNTTMDKDQMKLIACLPVLVYFIILSTKGDCPEDITLKLSQQLQWHPLLTEKRVFCNNDFRGKYDNLRENVKISMAAHQKLLNQCPNTDDEDDGMQEFVRAIIFLGVGCGTLTIFLVISYLYNHFFGHRH